MGQSLGIGPVSKDNAGVEQGCVVEGCAPDNPSSSLNLVDPVIGLEEETDVRIQGEQVPAGKADAVVAEVNGPGVVLT